MGRHLARRLGAGGRPVTVVDLAPPPATPPPGAVRFVRADVTDRAAVAAAIAGTDAVVHLAAKVSDFGRAADFERLNVGATRIVAEAARAAGVRRLVHMSSVAVFDYRRGWRDADEHALPGGHEFAYGQTKWRAEEEIRRVGGLGLETVVVRPGLFPYGPGDRVASARMLAAIERGWPVLVDGGRALLSTSYVDNLIDGLVLCLDHPRAAGETFHLSDDVRVTWRELGAAMARALGLPPPGRSVPKRVAAPAAATLELAWRGLLLRSAPPLTRYRVRTATSDLHFANGKAKRLLGWRPAVGLAEGMAATVAWYRGAPDAD